MSRDIAIIGIAGRFPQAKDILDFRRSLMAGTDSVRPISQSRKKVTGVPDRNYQVMGFMEEIDLFDHELFGLLPAEAAAMDPHQRILLEVAYSMFENAGYGLEKVKNTNTAVIIADTDQEYYKLATRFDPLLITGNTNAVASGRVSRFFGLKGNSMMVDTACSSSLVAIHIACRELLSGEAEMAIAGSVRLDIFLKEKTEGDRVGIMAPDGKAKSFSASANGTGNGEAAACILLKRLDDAIRDKDIIHAVIKGSSVNQDADRSSSLTAPSSIAQAEVITAAWKAAGIDPTTVTYIEAHGTGTRLGDPLEINGITRAFSSFTDSKQFCAVSSVKSNIGHTDSAAGISGLVKAVLALKYKELYPAVHFDEPNPFINFVDSPVYVNYQLKPWNALVRRAGVSSFGLSGTNCHIVLEEYNTPVSGQYPSQDHIFNISAKTPGALAGGISALEGYLTSKEDVSLRDISYTLNLGRAHYPYRYSIIASCKESLIQELQQGIYAVHPPVLPPSQVWFVFSGDSPVTTGMAEAFCSRYPKFLEAFSQCTKGVSASANGYENILRFAFQYAFHSLLASFGIVSKKLMGTGTGKLVVDVIQEKIALEKALTACVNDIPAPDGLDQKIKLFVQTKLTPGASTLLIEMGFAGIISRLLVKNLPLTNENMLISLDANGLENGDVLQVLQRLYRSGVDVNWNGIYDHDARKIELPGYSFDRKRHWIEPVASDPFPGWLYNLSWKKDETVAPSFRLSGITYLVFAYHSDTAAELKAKIISKGDNCIVVCDGKENKHISEDTYSIVWNEEGAYRWLFSALTENKVHPGGIIHLPFYPGDDPVSDNDPETRLSFGLYSHFYTSRAFHDLLRQPEFRFFIVTLNARDISGNECELDPYSGSTHGFMTSLIREYPQLNGRVIDVEHKDAVASSVEWELALPADKIITGYRNGGRYVPVVNKVKSGLTGTPISVTTGGTYIVTGGATGIGLEVCRNILAKEKVNIVVIGRREMPGREKWPGLSYDRSNSLSETARVFLEIERKGARVFYYSADVSNDNQLSMVMESIKNKLGSINGVIHSAGLPGGVSRNYNHDKSSFTKTLASKIHGTVNLWKHLSTQQLEFFILFSSIDAIVGVTKSGNYSAANMFLDGFSKCLKRQGVRSVSINWPAWRETGLWKRFNDASDKKLDASQSILTSEGLRSMDIAFRSGLDNVIVSNLDPNLLGENPFFSVEAPVETPLAAGISITPDSVYEDIAYTENPEWTDTENKVCKVWMAVLKLERLAIDTNYFAMGGHSLMGVRIINRLESIFDIDLEFSDLFRYPTVRDLAAFIDKEAGVRPAAGNIPKAGKQLFYPLSGAQKRIWVMTHFKGAVQAYNVPGALIMEGDLDIGALEYAFLKVIERHESLRTIFVEHEGEPVQRVLSAEESNFKMEVVILEGEDRSNEKINALVDEEVNWEFDLERGPLLRVKIIRTSVASHILVFNIHHIICDGISNEIFIEELLVIYDARIQHKELVLVPAKIQYTDFVMWQQQRMNDGSLERQKHYWFDKLRQPLTVPELPIDFQRKKIQRFNGAIAGGELGLAESKSLRKIAKENKITLYPLLMAAFKVLLHKYSNSTDILIGTNIAGRAHRDLERMIGLFVNTNVIRSNPDPGKTFTAYVQEVDNAIVEAADNEEYQFDDLVRELGINSDFSRNPLFDVMFVYNNTETTDRKISGLRLLPYAIPHNVAKFDMTITIEAAHENIYMNVEYRKDVLFREETILLMLGRFNKLLAEIIATPDAPIGSYKMQLDIEAESNNTDNINFDFSY